MRTYRKRKPSVNWPPMNTDNPGNITTQGVNIPTLKTGGKVQWQIMEDGGTIPQDNTYVSPQNLINSTAWNNNRILPWGNKYPRQTPDVVNDIKNMTPRQMIEAGLQFGFDSAVPGSPYKSALEPMGTRTVNYGHGEIGTIRDAKAVTEKYGNKTIQLTDFDPKYNSGRIAPEVAYRNSAINQIDELRPQLEFGKKPLLTKENFQKPGPAEQNSLYLQEQNPSRWEQELKDIHNSKFHHKYSPVKRGQIIDTNPMQVYNGRGQVSVNTDYTPLWEEGLKQKHNIFKDVPITDPLYNKAMKLGPNSLKGATKRFTQEYNIPYRGIDAFQDISPYKKGGLVKWSIC